MCFCSLFALAATWHSILYIPQFICLNTDGIGININGIAVDILVGVF